VSVPPEPTRRNASSSVVGPSAFAFATTRVCAYARKSVVAASPQNHRAIPPSVGWRPPLSPGRLPLSNRLAVLGPAQTSAIAPPPGPASVLSGVGHETSACSEGEGVRARRRSCRRCRMSRPTRIGVPPRARSRRTPRNSDPRRRQPRFHHRPEDAVSSFRNASSRNLVHESVRPVGRAYALPNAGNSPRPPADTAPPVREWPAHRPAPCRVTASPGLREREYAGELGRRAGVRLGHVFAWSTPEAGTAAAPLSPAISRIGDVCLLALVVRAVPG